MNSFIKSLILMLTFCSLVFGAEADSSASFADSLECAATYRATMLKDSTEVQASWTGNMSCTLIPVRSEIIITTEDGRNIDPEEVLQVQKDDGSWKTPKTRLLQTISWILNGVLWVGLIYLIAN